MEFEDSRDADDAVYELNSKELCGERVIVEHARGPRRDRDGYSYGSRSESYPRALRVLGTWGGRVQSLGWAGWDLPSPGRRGGWGLSALGVPGLLYLHACPDSRGTPERGDWVGWPVD